MHTDMRARAPRRNPIMAYSPYDSPASVLLRTDQSGDHRRPPVDLALHEAGDLVWAHGCHFDRVLLDLTLHLLPLQGLDNLAVGARDNVGRKPGRSRQRIPGRDDEIGMAEFAQCRHIQALREPRCPEVVASATSRPARTCSATIDQVSMPTFT